MEAKLSIDTSNNDAWDGEKYCYFTPHGLPSTPNWGQACIRFPKDESDWLEPAWVISWDADATNVYVNMNAPVTASDNSSLVAGTSISIHVAVV